MKRLKRFIGALAELFQRTDSDSVYAMAGHSTLFLIISFFPFVMLLLAAVPYAPVTEAQVETAFNGLFSGGIQTTVQTAIGEIFDRSGSMTLSITAITLLWTASTSVYSVMLGLNRVYNHKETRNYFLVRGISLLYTVIFLAALLIALILMVFGNSIVKVLQSLIPSLSRFDSSLNFGRQILAFLLILFFFDLLYTIVPNRPSRMLFELPGAVVSALGWYIYSFFYSIYIQNFSNVSYVYGSLAAIVLLMVWLYFCMYIFFVGAEVNQMAEQRGWCRARRAALKEKKAAQKERRSRWKIREKK